MVVLHKYILSTWSYFIEGFPKSVETLLSFDLRSIHLRPLKESSFISIPQGKTRIQQVDKITIIDHKIIKDIKNTFTQPSSQQQWQCNLHENEIQFKI